jgi:hypothetical protein
MEFKINKSRKKNEKKTPKNKKQKQKTKTTVELVLIILQFNACSIRSYLSPEGIIRPVVSSSALT